MGDDVMVCFFVYVNMNVVYGLVCRGDGESESSCGVERDTCPHHRTVFHPVIFSGNTDIGGTPTAHQLGRWATPALSFTPGRKPLPGLSPTKTTKHLCVDRPSQYDWISTQPRCWNTNDNKMLSACDHLEQGDGRSGPKEVLMFWESHEILDSSAYLLKGPASIWGCNRSRVLADQRGVWLC